MCARSVGRDNRKRVPLDHQVAQTIKPAGLRRTRWIQHTGPTDKYVSQPTRLFIGMNVKTNPACTIPELPRRTAEKERLAWWEELHEFDLSGGVPEVGGIGDMEDWMMISTQLDRGSSTSVADRYVMSDILFVCVNVQCLQLLKYVIVELYNCIIHLFHFFTLTHTR